MTLNRPIVDWDAPIFSPTLAPFPLAADLAEKQAEMMAAHVQARVSAEHNNARLHEFAVDTLNDYMRLHHQHELLRRTVAELMAALVHVEMDGITLRLVCNVNRAMNGR